MGGARQGWVGEVVLAHNGVLFLDELSEFSRAALEALRQPLEEGRVAIARAAHSAVYPARFMLIAATNPCPCGYAGEGERCRCGEAELARHRRRLSGAAAGPHRPDGERASQRESRAARRAAIELAGMRARACCARASARRGGCATTA